MATLAAAAVTVWLLAATHARYCALVPHSVSPRRPEAAGGGGGGAGCLGRLHFLFSPSRSARQAGRHRAAAAGRTQPGIPNPACKK